MNYLHNFSTEPRNSAVEDCKELGRHKHSDVDFRHVRAQAEWFGWGWADDFIELHENPAARIRFQKAWMDTPELEYEDFVSQMNELVELEYRGWC